MKFRNVALSICFLFLAIGFFFAGQADAANGPIQQGEGSCNACCCQGEAEENSCSKQGTYCSCGCSGCTAYCSCGESIGSY